MRAHKLLVAAALLLLSLGAMAQKGSQNSAVTTAKAPILHADSPSAIPGQYIVVFKDSVGRSAMTTVADMVDLNRGNNPQAMRYITINGFAAKIAPGILRQIQDNSDVAYIEQDQRVSLSANQSNPPWGLDRIDQCALPLDNNYNYNFDGTGVTAYILDSGVCNHADFGGRFSTSGYTPPFPSNPCNSSNSGHGTHVAGTVGGATYGVAKNVDLVDVPVLDGNGNGTISSVVGGVDWVAANHSSPAVANMSLGGGASTTLDNSVNNAVAAGVFFAVAAGNSNANACNSSPARAADAYTVGSTTSSDARSSFSNFGTCLDIFAPGSSIQSTWNTGFNSTATISGTSMASPHVAGVAALILDANPSASPSSIASTLDNWAAINYLSGIGPGSPNALLQNQQNNCPPGGGGGGPSCLPSGSACSSNSDCCSNSCSGWFTLTCN